jgi:hypothetical protein
MTDDDTVTIAITAPSTGDAELDAIQFIINALRRLGPSARRRVLRYAIDREDTGDDQP